jgi:pyruvate/2-oxoglutarate dehydrogenase complex dihydrolipoamide acyltransferase (E2) component
MLLYFWFATQGTIVEWVVQVGQKVNEGDVVCLIETDKVTVDIKAEVGGVIVSLFGSV